LPIAYYTELLRKQLIKSNLLQKFGNEKHRDNAERIIKSLISKRSRSLEEDGEARVDYIADRLSMVKEDVISAINVMREEKILGDMKDLSAYIRKGDSRKQSIAIATEFVKIENFLFSQVDEDLQVLDLKELNEQAGSMELEEVSTKKIKTILTYWAIKNYIKIKNHTHSKDHFSVQLCYSKHDLLRKLNERHGITRAVIENLHQRSIAEEHQGKEEVLVEFSVFELKEALEKDGLLGVAVSVDTIEDVLFFLSRIGAIAIEGGFMVIYNRMTIKRLEQNNRIDYKENNYKKLKEFYDNKVQQIHVVGEYAKKMISDYKEALLFVDDYFQLEYDSFLRKYFQGSRKNEIRRSITSGKYKQLFGDLSDTQASIINDKDSQYMVVVAGPGSGKTKVLVHKLASLILMEGVKQENLLMLTFSRAAASEFRARLIDLIGNAATYVEIKTFHSYCFDLLGKVGTIEKSDTIVQAAIDQICRDEVEQSRITKTVLVIDEAQDLDAKEFELVSLLMERNPSMRVIAVGDDDQNIFSFRGSDSRYMQQWIDDKGAKVYELSSNYRSRANIVDFTNQFVETIKSRLKSQAIESKYVEAGNIKLIQHESKNLITPVIVSILSMEITGSTAILTSTNQEAFQIAGLLLREGVKARLIQSAEGFDLMNLLEVREFVKMLNLKDGMRTIDNEAWENAKRNFRDKFQDSSRREVCISMIEVFERNYPKTRYVSDLEIFIRESHLEDFINARQETIMVSTMHKAKGREFDNVIILLEDFDISTDDKKRQLYVAMTRAKQNLTIHCNDSFLDFIQADHLERVADRYQYEPSDTMILHLTHRDVQLGYFENLQQQINSLWSGEPLILTDVGCLNTKRQMVAKFSSSFLEQLEKYKAKGFHPREAKVNFIVYWKDSEKEKEVKIVLPELVLERPCSRE
jgi:ATP-dependent DNA helicase RecQ